MKSKLIGFGTAGLRATMGPGYDQMNAQVVAMAAQALAQHMEAERDSESAPYPPVVIGYDIRHNSARFAKVAAIVLASYKIPTLRFPEPVGTPVLAYSIRPLKAAYGIMITASHNDKRYNGMKLYGSDGIQTGEEFAASISSKMHALYEIDSNPDKKIAELGLDHDLTPYLQSPPPSLCSEYIATIQAELLDSKEPRPTADATCMARHREADKQALAKQPLDTGATPIKIAYSPMHGVGGRFLPAIFAGLPGMSCHCEPEQSLEDPEFTGIPRPNPEFIEVLAKVQALGEEIEADIILATDPDADRLALMLPDETGTFQRLDGNQTGALVFAYYLKRLRERGELPARPCLVKSIVSDNFARSIAEAEGIECVESLTGFKNICGKIKVFQSDPEPKRNYIMGYEESIGFALGQSVLDKDGMRAAAYLAKAAQEAKSCGSSLYKQFLELQERYGYFQARPIQLTLEGSDGQAQIQALMHSFRHELISEVAGLKLTRYDDYLAGQSRFFAPDQAEQSAVIDELHSDVLRFHYGSKLWFAARPSGTEPKIKFYLYSQTATRAEGQSLLATLCTVLASRGVKLP